jgi:predicted dehydrogenase
MVLGEFREVSAHIENLRPEVTHVTSGAVAANGTEGDLVVKADQAQWWSGRLRLYGARGNDDALAELPVPGHYQRSLMHWTGRSAEPAYNVAHAYALLREQITGSLAPDTEGVPDFLHAVRQHRMLEQIRDAATDRPETHALIAGLVRASPAW